MSSSRVIGVDFDNTIVCYDALFHKVSLERGWIPPHLPANKSEVRNHLRRQGREEDWTELQGFVYGARMSEAEAFPGVKNFLATCRTAGHRLYIISHKTKQPFRGASYDLHRSALDWLESQGFFSPGDVGLGRDQVFLELTKQAKLERIARQACDFFIDDLPEFLAEPAFPRATRPLLFDPANIYEAEPFPRLQRWSDANRLISC